MFYFWVIGKVSVSVCCLWKGVFFLNGDFKPRAIAHIYPQFLVLEVWSGVHLSVTLFLIAVARKDMGKYTQKMMPTYLCK